MTTEPTIPIPSEAEKRGTRAHLAGYHWIDNPYSMISWDERADWQHGWLLGYLHPDSPWKRLNRELRA